MRLEQKRKVGRWTASTVLATLTAVGAACGTNGEAGRSDSARATSALGERTGETGAAATAAAQSATGGADTPQTPGRSRTSRVVLLGTSLTAGLGLDPEVAYPALLQRKADSAGYAVRIVNAGLSGETSAGALRRAGWVLDQPAALVVLEVGANDGLRGVDPDSTYANIVALVQVVRTQRPEAGVVLVQMEAPPNLGGRYTTRFHQAYVRAAKVTGVTLLPFLLEGVAGDARLNQADGIHPNPEGSKRVADTVWRGLSPLLAKLAGE
jgi:acyl-CoA thioesterase-1